MLRQTTIGQKVGAGFCALILILAVFGFFSFRSTNRLGGALDRAIHTTATKMDRVGALSSSFHELVARAKSTHLQYVIRHFEAKSNNQTCSACHGDDTIQAAVDGFHGALAATRGRIGAVRAVGVSESERAALDTVEQRVNEWESLYSEYLADASKGDFESAHEIITQKMYPTIAEVDKNVATLEKGQQTDLDQAGTASAAVISGSRWTTIVLTLAGVVISAAVMLLMAQMCRSLKGLIRAVGRGAREVASAATQVSERSQELAGGSSRQHEALERTFTAGSEASQAAGRNAAHASSAAEIVRALQQDTAAAERSLAAMKDLMDGITRASEKVGGIAKLIDEVAFQTNMLALNAAVEAARAGESGAGFSVVADEVRSLAQKCAAAAKDATELIEEAVSKSRTGREHLGRASEVVSSVSRQVARVAEIAAEVHDESQEQARSMGAISSALNEVQQNTREAASNAQSGAEAGEELSEQSVRMQDAVGELIRMIG